MPRFAYDALWQIKQRAITWLTNRGLVEAFSVLLGKQIVEFGITHVIDVGANRGQFGQLLRRLGYAGKIISFEPVQHTFSALQSRAKHDPNWDIHRLALGERNEEVSINVTSSDDFSSLLKPNESCARIFSESSQRLEEVSVRRLDELLPSLVPESQWSSTHLKLDTQGFDLDVMRGAGRCLDNIRSLQSELSVIRLYENQPGYLEVLRFLESRGFTPSCISPVSRHLGLPVVEFDALFCRSEFSQPHERNLQSKPAIIDSADARSEPNSHEQSVRS